MITFRPEIWEFLSYSQPYLVFIELFSSLGSIPLVIFGFGAFDGIELFSILFRIYRIILKFKREPSSYFRFCLENLEKMK